MAFQTTTVTDYIDALVKIEAFAVAQGWTVHAKYDENGDPIVSYNTTSPAGILANNLILHSTGTSTQDDFYLKIQSRGNIVAGYYNLRVQAGSEVDPDNSHVFLYNTTIGISATLNAQPMTIWMFGDANYIMFVCRISTSYVGAYMGRFDAYGLPDAYPKPICVCANSNSSTVAYDSGSNVGIMDTSLGISMMKADSSLFVPNEKISKGLLPLSGFHTSSSINYLNIHDDITNDLMERLEFFNTNVIYGALTNCMYITAVNHAPEDIQQVANGANNDNYIVFGNLTVTTEGNLFAVYKDTTA